jgi:hypothetical protein
MKHSELQTRIAKLKEEIEAKREENEDLNLQQKQKLDLELKNNDEIKKMEEELRALENQLAASYSRCR